MKMNHAVPACTVITVIIVLCSGRTWLLLLHKLSKLFKINKLHFELVFVSNRPTHDMKHYKKKTCKICVHRHQRHNAESLSLVPPIFAVFY